MKTRLGFVSNSSSSSFIVISKDDTLADALSNHYDVIMGIPNSGFLSELKRDFVEQLANNEYNYFSSAEDFEEFPKLTKDNVYSRDFELPAKVEKLLEKGFNAFLLDLPDYGEGGTVLQNAARNAFTEIESDDFYLYKFD